MCYNHAKGNCWAGENCKFAHDEEELKVGLEMRSLSADTLAEKMSKLPQHMQAFLTHVDLDTRAIEYFLQLTVEQMQAIIDRGPMTDANNPSGLLITRINKVDQLVERQKERERRPGDWPCPTCGVTQFARAPACKGCGTPNPDPAPNAARPAPSQPMQQVQSMEQMQAAAQQQVQSIDIIQLQQLQQVQQLQQIQAQQMQQLQMQQMQQLQQLQASGDTVAATALLRQMQMQQLQQITQQIAVPVQPASTSAATTQSSVTSAAALLAAMHGFR